MVDTQISVRNDFFFLKTSISERKMILKIRNSPSHKERDSKSISLYI